ncbi:endolytic transglycosylase MltG [Cellulomonas sp. APG4]|uniref:endolytic transglycosylase MltG n=1 Tax=Cellulomonas sp. APG4 TaxID=1538656 RepID=UPI00137AFEAF|nr:endolytic transglycosylase MltG [Cellulomonas sp. APG4]NCT90874.1 endolytic transglycosylase MltG [Cellulomonas sp. APG4]
MSDLFLDEVIRPESAGGDGRRARRPGREERQRKRRQRRRRTVIALVVALGLLGGAAWAVVTYVLPTIQGFSLGESESADDFPGPGHGSVQVVIPPESTGGAMAAILHEQGVVASERAFTRAFTANPDASGIQPGTYNLLLEMSGAGAVDALLNPENRVQTRVTIPEGLRVDQILERLSSVTAVPVEEFETAMADTAAVGLPAEAGGNYEGWLFGATYTFEPGTTPTEMLAQMVQATITTLDEAGVAPEDRQRVLTIASLVEREARTPEDRAMVAQAIQNRLDRDMKLDIDASVAYGAGKSGTELTREDLDTDGPYNLYTRTGLPPTPIASPSAVAINAVMNPTPGDWIFWVTVNLDTGETKFAETLGEHNENVEELRAWQRENE